MIRYHAQVSAWPGRTPRSRRAQKRFSVEGLLRLAAAPAVVIYGGLFLAYRSYYGRLGVDPEDVGVDNAYILSRSLGFVTVVTFFTLCAAATLTVDGIKTSDDWLGLAQTAGVAIVKIALSTPFALFMYLTLNPSLDWRLKLLLSIVAVLPQMVSMQTLRGLTSWADLSVYTAIVVLGVVLTVTALVTRAHYCANEALQGNGSVPVEYFSVPVLDLDAPQATVQWTGTPTQRPAFFPPTGLLTGTLIGHGQGAEFILQLNESGATLLRIPSASSTTQIVLKAPDLAN